MKKLKLDKPMNLQMCIQAQQLALNKMTDDRVEETLQDLLYAFNQSIILMEAWKELILLKIENNYHIKNILENNLKELGDEL